MTPTSTLGVRIIKLSYFCSGNWSYHRCDWYQYHTCDWIQLPIASVSILMEQPKNILSTGQLVVSDVTENYRKWKFACQSQNTYSNLCFMSLLARLYSKEPTDFSPENIFGPKDQYIWEGETITLESQASSYQFPESHHS